MAIKIGEKIPDFALFDQNGKQVKLSELKGRKVLLSFHPLAWTSVCATQMKSLEDNREAFAKLNVVPLGVSVDSGPSKKAWAKELGIEHVSLISDFWPHGGLAKELGIFHEQGGFSERANILLDEEGRVLWYKVYPMSELPDIREVLAAVQKKAA